MLVIILLLGLLAVMVLMVKGGGQPAAKPIARQPASTGDRMHPAHVCDVRCQDPAAMCPYQVPPDAG